MEADFDLEEEEVQREIKSLKDEAVFFIHNEAGLVCRNMLQILDNSIEILQSRVSQMDISTRYEGVASTSAPNAVESAPKGASSRKYLNIATVVERCKVIQAKLSIRMPGWNNEEEFSCEIRPSFPLVLPQLQHAYEHIVLCSELLNSACDHAETVSVAMMRDYLVSVSSELRVAEEYILNPESLQRSVRQEASMLQPMPPRGLKIFFSVLPSQLKIAAEFTSNHSRVGLSSHLSSGTSSLTERMGDLRPEEGVGRLSIRTQLPTVASSVELLRQARAMCYNLLNKATVLASAMPQHIH